MALVRNSFAAGLETFLNGSIPLPVASGGSGAADAATARTNLGLGTVAIESTVPVAKGGTGATTAAAALDALGSIGVTASSIANPGYIKFNLPGTTDTFMIQWGSGTASGNTSGQAVTYPIAFTSFSIPIMSGGTSSITADENWGQPYAASTTGFTFAVSNASSHTYYWIAVGL